MSDSVSTPQNADSTFPERRVSLDDDNLNEATVTPQLPPSAGAAAHRVPRQQSEPSAERAAGAADDGGGGGGGDGPYYRQLGGGASTQQQHQQQQQRPSAAPSAAFAQSGDEFMPDFDPAEMQRAMQNDPEARRHLENANNNNNNNQQQNTNQNQPQQQQQRSTATNPAAPKRPKKQPSLAQRGPPMPPLILRRNIQSCHTVLAVLCLVLGPGMVATSGMMASAAAFTAPYGSALLGSLSGIFFPLGLVFIVGSLWFLLFSDGVFSYVEWKEEKEEEDDDDDGGDEEMKEVGAGGGARAVGANEPTSEASTHEASGDNADENNEKNNKKKGEEDEDEQSTTCCVWLLRLVVVIIILVSCIVMLLATTIYSMKVNKADYTVYYSSVTPPSGKAVHLQRDPSGIVHVHAETRSDAMFGLGFAQAQDRLFQLELVRLIGTGTLASVVGKAGLKVDRLMRTLRMSEAAHQTFNGLSSANQQLCSAMAAGINAYMRDERARPPEFLMMGQMLQYHEPKAWEAWHCALYFRLLQYQMSTSSFNMEVRRWKQFTSTRSASMSYDDLQAFFADRMGTNNATTPFSESDLSIVKNSANYATALSAESTSAAAEKTLYDNTITPTYRSKAQEGTASRVRAAKSMENDEQKTQQQQQQNSHEKKKNENDDDEEFENEEEEESSSWFSKFLPNNGKLHNAKAVLDHILGDAGTLSASNAWVARAAGGNAMHASDPHLANTVPCVWYMAHIHIADESNFHISGGTPVGIPAILNGRTNFVRFGSTLSITDQGDLFIMVPDTSVGGGNTHYIRSSVSTAYTIYNEKIAVYGADDEDLTVRVASHYGPDVAQVMNLAASTSSLRICAYIEALQDDTDTMAAVMDTNRPTTTTVTVFQTLMRKIRSPGLGITFSDESGGIGTAITGRHRIRASGHTGRVATMGNGNYDYTGEVPAASMPSKVDTATSTNAYMWAANSRPDPAGFTYRLGYDYTQARARVLSAELANTLSTAPAQLGLASYHQTLQANKKSGFWIYMIKADLQLHDATSSRGAVFAAKLDTAGTARWAQMKSWDGVARAGSTEASDLWRWVYLMVSVDPVAYAERSFLASTAVMEYVTGLMGKPTARQQGLCATQVGDSVASADSCVRYAGKVWNSVVSGFARQGWAVDVADTLYVKHLLLHGSIAQGLFSRKITKAGDPSSLDVTKLVKGDIYSNPEGALFVPANGASARWIFQQMNSASGPLLVNFPGGNSGQVFSEFYFNFATAYVHNYYEPVWNYERLATGDDDKTAGIQRLGKGP